MELGKVGKTVADRINMELGPHFLFNFITILSHACVQFSEKSEPVEITFSLYRAKLKR